MWGNNIVWGNSISGNDDDNIVWGTEPRGIDDDNIVWGNLDDDDNIVWGNSALLGSVVTTAKNRGQAKKGGEVMAMTALQAVTRAVIGDRTARRRQSQPTGSAVCRVLQL